MTERKDYHNCLDDTPEEKSTNSTSTWHSFNRSFIGCNQSYGMFRRHSAITTVLVTNGLVTNGLPQLESENTRDL
jgi:hypothetical protein